MGATTFYLLELEKKQKERLKQQNQEDEKQANKENAEKQNINIDYNKLTKDETKEILKEKGIDYDSRAKKDELIKLLKEVNKRS